jgi:hypothetical protein
MFSDLIILSKCPSPGLDPEVYVFLAEVPEGKTWMPTDQVRGLKARGSGPATGRGWLFQLVPTQL